MVFAAVCMVVVLVTVLYGGLFDGKEQKMKRYPQRVHKQRTSSPQVHILVHTYGQQLTKAIKNMVFHQCICGSLNTSSLIAEPFTSNSTLYLPPKFKSKSRVEAHFSQYYDLDFFNTKSVEAGDSPLLNWEHFLESAPRKVVLVAFRGSNCGVEWTKVNHSIWGLEAFNFSVVKTVLLCAEKVLSLAELWNLIDIEGQSDVTVLFDTWRSYVKNFVDVQRHCLQHSRDPGVYASRLRPSQGIFKHAENYRHKFIKSDRVIAIMLRVERFLETPGRAPNKTIDSCLQEILALYHKLHREMGETDSGVFVTADVGRFGSGLMQNTTQSRFRKDVSHVTESVAVLISELYGGQFSLQTWEDSFTEASEGITERGYIAILQRSIATSADCLVVMGGGSFQEVAADEYIQKHPNTQCLHRVCVSAKLKYAHLS